MRGEFSPDITPEEIAVLPKITFGGEIVLVDNLAKFEEVIGELFKYDFSGLDTETRPSFQKGHQYQVSLLQVFCGGKCYLFRLNMIGFPEALRLWFENDQITKVGLSLRDDIRELRKKKEMEPQALIDLQEIVHDYGIEALSLKKICAIVLGGHISKKQQLSNWEAETLTDKQQIYAATDAWACLEIYNKLKQV